MEGRVAEKVDVGVAGSSNAGETLENGGGLAARGRARGGQTMRAAALTCESSHARVGTLRSEFDEVRQTLYERVSATPKVWEKVPIFRIVLYYKLTDKSHQSPVSSIGRASDS
jgi:hypothetical protein